MNCATRKLLSAAMLTAAVTLAACGSDDNNGGGNNCSTNPTAPGCVATGEGVLEGDITANRTLYAETTYTIRGFVHIANGATLTIRPGTKLLGDFNTFASSLFVLRGAKIDACGTADAPIVFSSSQPVGQRRPGDWGGLIIVGNAVSSRTGGDIAVEGTGTDQTGAPGTNYTVVYNGGTDNADNSGRLCYVRVEYAGYAPSPNNELNAFTFAAVGSGTQLTHLEALAGLDDSYEFFGGAVNGDHLVSYESGDDHFDMSEGYVGHLQYLIAYQTEQLVQRSGAGTPSADPQGIENDGCNGNGCADLFNTQPFTVPVVANFTLVGTGDVASSGGSGGIGMMLRRGTGGYYVNGIVARWPRAGVSLRDADTYARAGSVATPDLATADLALNSILFVETPAGVFQPTSADPAAPLQFSFDLASNALAEGATTTASLFTAFPATVDINTTASAFDWTPAAGSLAATTAGLSTFTGKLAAAAGPVTATSYVGAAQPGGEKWWSGWTVYARDQ
jgi:hypothetical protein